MTDEIECGEGCTCIMCKVIALLDKVAELQGGDHDKGLELILFSAGALPPTVEGYPLRLVIERISRVYAMTERDILAAYGDAPGEGAAVH